MEIRLYKTESPRNKLIKELSNENVLTGALRAQSSAFDPVFTIQDINVLDYNYCYIPDFNGYYYINNITALRSNLYELECHMDVLMTYKEDIKSNTEIVNRSATMSNNYIPSNTWYTDVRQNTEVMNFPKGFNDTPIFVLITAGATI